MNHERLTRFAKGASPESKRYFGKSLIEALDRLGVDPGQEFIIGPVYEQPSLEAATHAPDAIDANAVGGARTTDPNTSKEAATQVFPRSGTQRYEIFMAILRAGERGLTAHEACAEACVEYRSGTPRIGELKNGGWVVSLAHVTRLSPMQANAEVLVATDKGVREAR